MHRYWLLMVLLSFQAASISSLAQEDNIGSGRAIRFDGIDDFIDLGDQYHDLNLPFSITAWIFIDPSVNYPVPIMVGNDNDPVYRGFWFFISDRLIWCEFGDGTGGANPFFRRGKQAAISNVVGRWIHVSAVMKAPFEIDLYVNGINVGGQTMGESNLSMASTFPGDHPKIGYFLSNNVTYRFKGIMDEFRLFNKALTQGDIRSGMCTNVPPSQTGLIGHWNFNELSGSSVKDKSANSFNGTLMGNPVRVYSGAPIGNSSQYNYTTNWLGLTYEFADGDNRVLVNNIQNNPEGIHIYKVISEPSQTAGLNNVQIRKPYYGVFPASLDNDNKFDLTLLFMNKITCKAYLRNDNSVATWVNTNMPVVAKTERGEFLPANAVPVEFDLGNDITACSVSEVTLNTNSSDPNISFLWNTGETTSTIKAVESGKYWVRAENVCGVKLDSVTVTFAVPPTPFSFGEDQRLCKFVPVELKPYELSDGIEFLWQDGSINDSFTANDYGTYSVIVKNACGETSSSITYSPKIYELQKPPNVITPDGDKYNQYLDFREDEKLDFGRLQLLVINRWGKEVYQSNDYKNDWDAPDLSSGVYFYTLYGSCIQTVKGSLLILK